MLSFATEFPVAHTHSSADFLEAVKTWLLGSPHTLFVASDLEDVEGEPAFLIDRHKERFESLRVESALEDSAAVRYTVSDRGLEWVSTIVFSRQNSDSWIGIRVFCESRSPAARLPNAKKPVVVRTLLNQLGGAADGFLAVQSRPLRLADVDIDVAARCINGRVGCRLPIIYVSAGFNGDYAVDVTSLAEAFSGMAHVIVEPNRPFSVRLMRDVDGQNVYGGAIGVYWPDAGGRRSVFIGPEFESARDLKDAIIAEVQSALANRRPLDRCTWAAVQEAASRRAFKALTEAGSTEIASYVQEFDNELAAKTDRLIHAEREIARLQAEVKKYEARAPMATGVLLRQGVEQDLYDGEVLEIVRDALADAMSRVTVDSRRRHVLTSVINATPSLGAAKSKRETLKAILRVSRGLDAKARRDLGEMGFEIEDAGKHYKITFQGDDRYTFSLQKSGSDVRGGLNAANDISRLLF